MKDGIWTSPDKYISFADGESQAADREALQQELYTGPFGFDPLSWLGILPDPDPVLRKTGDSVSVLRDLTADDKVLSSIQNRKLGTLKKTDYGFSPGHLEDEDPSSDAVMVCDALKADLERVDLYNLFAQVLDAPYYGMTTVEIIWEAAGGALHIRALKPRPVEWFDFNANQGLIYIGDQSVVLPEKLVAARHFPDATNPYGLRLLSRCLWPVAIKKGGIKFWTMLCEKFGMPWVVGKAPSGAEAPERQKIAGALAAMVQDAVAVVSAGTEVDVHGFEAKSGSLHPDLVKYMDMCIARVLHGQSINNEGTGTGSYAESKTSYDALGDYREADERLLCAFMEELAWVYTRLNSATALSPAFKFREPEDYGAQADLDTKLHTTGVRFTKTHYTRRYNLTDDEFDLAARPGTGKEEPSGSGKKTGGAEFVAPGGFTPAQQAIEDLVAELMESAPDALADGEQLIMEAILASGSYEEAFERILKLYPQMTVDTLQDLLEPGLMNAGAFGMYAVQGESA